MVVTASLNSVDLSVLTPVFNAAFGDYDLPLNMSEEALLSHLMAIDYSKADSVGLFDEGDLVGFLLIGRRGSQAWDGGTAIIPSYRGRGLAHLLIEAAIEGLSDSGCTTFTLEVLDTNVRAKNLYLAHGFVQERTLNCYQSLRALLPAPTAAIRQGEPLFSLTAEPLFRPSWQNAPQSIAKGGYLCSTLVLDGRPIAEAAFHIARGSIAQIMLADGYRTVAMMKEAIVACAGAMEADLVRAINIDSCDTLTIAAFEALGFERFTTQTEMLRRL